MILSNIPINKKQNSNKFQLQLQLQKDFDRELRKFGRIDFEC